MAARPTCERLFDTNFTNLLRATHRTDILTKTKLLVRFLNEKSLGKSQRTTRILTYSRHTLHVTALVRMEPSMTAKDVGRWQYFNLGIS
jgi:hypothetical protein